MWKGVGFVDLLLFFFFLKDGVVWFGQGTKDTEPKEVTTKGG